MLAPVVVQELIRLDGGPCYIPLLLHLGLLDESELASLGGIGGRCGMMFLLIGMNGIHVDHGVMGVKLVLPGDRECHLGLDGDLNNEYGALVQLADHLYLPAHQAHQLVRDPKAESRPPILCLDAFISLRKRLKELFNALLGNTYASVDDFDDQVPLDVRSYHFLKALDFYL